MKCKRYLAVMMTIGAVLLAQMAAAETAIIKTGNINGRISIVNWFEQKFEGIVRQSFDDSCGAASLATLLSSYYGLSITEGDIIDRMENVGRTSFLELSLVADGLGNRSIGIKLPFNELIKLKIPAIVYLSYRGTDHFSVLRGIGPTGNVLLADPIWGNIKFTQEKFKEMWEVTSDRDKKVGKLLLVFSNSKTIAQENYFLNQVTFEALMSFGHFDTKLLY